MVIEKLVLENFRNFESLDLSMNRGFVVLVGPNAAGKTNFLEAVYFGGGLRRFPETSIGQLFRNGKTFLKVKLWVKGDHGKTEEVFLEKRERGLTGVFKVDNQRVSRGKYGEGFYVIGFLPQDMILLAHSPGNRRRFLDETLANVSGTYRRTLLDYHQALKQRNNLWEKIKAGEKSEGEMVIWDEKLSEFGSILTRERADFLDYVNEKIGQILGGLSPELQETRFLYRKSGETTKEKFLEKLGAVKAAESRVGRSLIGPHRDDFLAALGGLEAVGYFSRGQMRALTLALKMVEREYIAQKRQSMPILLLDDVFSEFDAEHQKSLADFLRTFPQVFITATHLGQLEGYLGGQEKIFRVDKGRIVS